MSNCSSSPHLPLRSKRRKTGSSSRFARAPPPKPLPWIWVCHKCHKQWQFQATNRCLSCSHRFCGQCDSELDYCGWRKWDEYWNPAGTGIKKKGGWAPQQQQEEEEKEKEDQENIEIASPGSSTEWGDLYDPFEDSSADIEQYVMGVIDYSDKSFSSDDEENTSSNRSLADMNSSSPLEEAIIDCDTSPSPPRRQSLFPSDDEDYGTSNKENDEA